MASEGWSPYFFADNFWESLRIDGIGIVEGARPGSGIHDRGKADGGHK